MNDDTLGRRLGALRRSAAPAEDLWPRIEAAIDAGKLGRSARGISRGGVRQQAIGLVRLLPAPAWAGLGLAACIAAAAAVFLPRVLASRGDGRRAELQRELREAARDYHDARARLLASLRAAADGYGQETVSRIENDMESIDRLIAEVQSTGGGAADDGQPVYRLVELYRSQTAGIARADDLVRSVSYREEQQ